MSVLGVNLAVLFDKRVRYAKKVKNHCIRGLLKDCCEAREKSAWESMRPSEPGVSNTSIDYAHKAYVYTMFEDFQTNHCGTFMNENNTEN